MLEKVKSNPIMNMVIQTIIKEKQSNKPIESVILSRFNYDRLEAWLKSVGILNDENAFAPLTFYGVEIKRSETSGSTDIIPQYYSAKDPEQLAKNLENFGIDNGLFIDKIQKNINDKNKQFNKLDKTKIRK